MQHRLTDEDRAKGRRNRWAMMTPEARRHTMLLNAMRRWYKVTADDADRVDRHLIMLSKEVAEAMLEPDPIERRRGIIQGISAMVPYEKLKIMLRMSATKDVTLP